MKFLNLLKTIGKIRMKDLSNRLSILFFASCFTFSTVNLISCSSSSDNEEVFVEEKGKKFLQKKLVL